MIKRLLVLSALLVSGCASVKEPVIKTEVVNVAVPVACKVDIPERPVMPTDAKYLLELPADLLVDALLQAALAEIDVREGYEVRLVAAIKTCTWESVK